MKTASPVDVIAAALSIAVAGLGAWGVPGEMGLTGDDMAQICGALLSIAATIRATRHRKGE